MRVCWLLVCATLGGCGRIGYAELGGDAGATPDGAAASPDAAEPAPDAAPPDALGAWGAPVRLDSIDTDVDEDDPTLTSDMLEMVFASVRAGGLGGEDVWVTRRASIADPWGPPESVPELSSPSTETTPEISGDGLSIWLSSNRAGSVGSNDIWTSTRPTRADPWSTPVRVAELSTANDDASPTPWGGGLSMVLHNNTSGGPGSYDVFTSSRASAGSPWSPPVRLLDVCSPQQDIQPFQVDALTLYFSSDRGGDFDLYIATRPTAADPFDPAVPIAELNTALATENDPWVSGDQRTIYFTSTRGFGTDLDIYVSSR